MPVFPLGALTLQSSQVISTGPYAHVPQKRTTRVFTGSLDQTSVDSQWPVLTHLSSNKHPKHLLNHLLVTLPHDDWAHTIKTSHRLFTFTNSFLHSYVVAELDIATSSELYTRIEAADPRATIYTGVPHRSKGSHLNANIHTVILKPCSPSTPEHKGYSLSLRMEQDSFRQ